MWFRALKLMVHAFRINLGIRHLALYGLYVTDECWKVTGIQLKFICLVKQLSSCQATLSPENLKNTSNFEGSGLTLVAYKKMYIVDD